MNRRGVSLAYTALADKPPLARLAEERGFDVVWNSGDSIALNGAMAQATERAMFGTGVVRAFANEPRALAVGVAEVQELSGNRFILGLGGGTKRGNINQLGREFDHPATRIRELIHAMRLAWNTPASDPVDYSGQYVELTGSGLRGRGQALAFGRPYEVSAERQEGETRETPVYLAAVNGAMFRLAGDLCQGLCGHPMASVRFIQETAWPGIDVGLERTGRTRADFDHEAWIITAISSDRKQAMREAKHHMGRFMATRSYGNVLDSQGYEDVRHAIQNAFFNHRGDDEALIAAVPDEVAREHAIFGTPDDVREQAARYEGVVDTSTFYCASSLMSQQRIHENTRLMIETFGQ
ncbi:MAG: LLM class flavin-dependent oxidoreductase [Chloroflexi bacterium]|nr:LLM class flavin-dependent oxidoreductase [Chloroflexota bacterium]